MRDGSCISIGLLHYPVYNKNREVVTSSITTSSLHDISRTARTFGVENFYIITPIVAHQQLMERLVMHWQVGYGAQYNPTRRDALSNVSLVNSLGECLQDLKEKYQKNPVTIVTCARSHKNTISYRDLRVKIERDCQVYLIIFGTGWGIEKSLIEAMDFTIEPIYGYGGEGNYNHLSVRAAVAIILDRLINENR
ncbi:MAG: RNA methyltransferase [bacterium]